MNRSPIAVVVALCILHAGQAGAGYLLGERGKRSLDISAAVMVNGDYAMDSDGGAVSFGASMVRLVLSGNIAPSLVYLVQGKADNGALGLLDCMVKWKPCTAVSLSAGQFRAPFGRFSNVSGAKLLLRDRSPLAAFAPSYQIGLAPRLGLWGDRLAVSAGVFNGKGVNVHLNPDEHLMVSAEATIAPFGEVPLEESAQRGYSQPVFCLVPAFYRNPVRTVASTDSVTGEPLEYVDVTTTSAGCGAALRYKYLAVDGGFYARSVHDPRRTSDVRSAGSSVQAAYALRGRLEPAARVSLVDPDVAVESNEKLTVECGVNYYFTGYDSWVGLNYTRASVRTSEGWTATSGVRLFYEFCF